MEEIKAGDIMIGNIVTVDNPKHHPKLKGVPLRVTGIQEVDFGNSVECHLNLEHINQDPNTYYDTYSQFFRFIRPIHLTEEILLKAGGERFDEDKILLMLNDPSTYLVLMKVGTHWFPQIEQTGEFASEGMNSVHLNFIDYAHQAQILFKSLTGNELEVNL